MSRKNAQKHENLIKRISLITLIITYFFYSIDKTNKKIDLLNKEIGGLKESVKNLKQQISTNSIEISNNSKKIDVINTKTEHSFEFDEINEFINSNLYGLKKSPNFFCNQISIPWYITLKKKEIDKVKYLFIFLHINGEINCNCSIYADVELIILNKSNKMDKHYSFKQLYENEDGFGYGSNMITLDDLKKGGFINNDKIEIKVKMQLNKLTCQKIYKM